MSKSNNPTQSPILLLLRFFSLLQSLLLGATPSHIDGRRFNRLIKVCICTGCVWLIWSHALPCPLVYALEEVHPDKVIADGDSDYSPYEYMGDEESHFFKATTWISLPLLLLLAIAWFWNWSLKTQVKQRTQEIRQELLLRKQVETALRKSEAKYRDLVQSANSIIIRMDTERNVRFLNEFALSFFGYQDRRILEKYLVETVFRNQEGYGGDIAAIIQGALHSPWQHASAVSESMRGSGERVWISWTHTPIFDDDGDITEILCVGNNITDLKRAEQALRESEERYRELSDLLPQPVFETETGGILTFVNRAAFESFGFSKDDFDNGLSAFSLMIPEDREKCREDFRRRLTGENVNNTAYTALRGDGSLFPVVIYSSPIMKDNRPAGIRGIFLDITEQKKLEEERLKTQKLESLGVLAGGIAHDFNNILTAVIGNLSLARLFTADNPQVLDRLDETERACFRAKDLTQQLLTFSKGGAPVKRTVSISKLIRDSASFALRGSNVRCEFCIQSDLWPVEVDEGQFNQVINNLILNADQAMPEGGVIKVTAENMSKQLSGDLPIHSDKSVAIKVMDQGIGILKEHLPKIFDPYFTTKQTGNGLGLSTAYSIIAGHSGYLDVDSEPGVGTTFTIYLPASQKPVTGDIQNRGGMPLPGKGKILVMDDEPVIREVLGEMLTYIGYSVMAAGDGAETIELYERALSQSEPFDAVIMDLTIPGGMGGKEAVSQLLKLDPKIKAIVSSGYSNDPIMASFDKHGFAGVVSKPYRMEEISKVLHEVITKESRQVE